MKRLGIGTTKASTFFFVISLILAICIIIALLDYFVLKVGLYKWAMLIALVIGSAQFCIAAIVIHKNPDYKKSLMMAFTRKHLRKEKGGSA